MSLTELYRNYEQGKNDHRTVPWSPAAVDAGALLIDVAATAVPFVPGGAGSAVKAYRSANAFRNNIRAGKEFERSVIGAAKKEGRNVSSQITIIEWSWKCERESFKS